MITLTDTASVKVKELIAQEGDETLMLRVAVRPGCPGHCLARLVVEKSCCEQSLYTNVLGRSFGAPKSRLERSAAPATLVAKIVRTNPPHPHFFRDIV